MTPGRFIESAGGQRVFFIDKDRADADTGSNIFIAAREHGKETVTTAQSGRLEVIKGERFVVLGRGHRLELDSASGQTRVSEFVEYGNRIGTRLVGPTDNDSPTMKPTLALLSEPMPRHLGELSWRVGLILAALNCAIFALAATRVNPRVGRSAGLVFALFAFTTYYNLLTLGESWIARGRVGFGAYLLLLHGGILLLSAGWLLARHHGWGGAWRRRLPGGGR